MPDRRFTAVTTALIGLLLLGSAATAHAHGDTIHLTVTGVSAGHPVTKATWEDDGHPVNEKVAGTLTATSADGTSVGPWRFVPVAGEPGTFTTAEALPAGRWTITAQTAFPALGRAESQAEVAPASVAPSPAAPAAGTPRAAAPRTESDGGPGVGTPLAIGGAALFVAIGGFATFRVRRRRNRPS
ncbi:hypothetical protein [Streptomyces violascens]|uniref:hypothetical protein n=1 Tax=Streptomyces violascens TaxID=67381 RepID=UPI001673378B|nr:hypothetical protein [Streptomyces violascens]GGU52570.1 hypothetical protein GCM10010289_85920 [Streptomyces violascens]